MPEHVLQIVETELLNFIAEETAREIMLRATGEPNQCPDDVWEQVMKLFPDGNIQDDGTGQAVIYTGMSMSDDD